MWHFIKADEKALEVLLQNGVVAFSYSIKRPEEADGIIFYDDYISRVGSLLFRMPFYLSTIKGTSREKYVSDEITFLDTGDKYKPAIRLKKTSERMRAKESSQRVSVPKKKDFVNGILELSKTLQDQPRIPADIRKELDDLIKLMESLRKEIDRPYTPIDVSSEFDKIMEMQEVKSFDLGTEYLKMRLCINRIDFDVSIGINSFNKKLDPYKIRIDRVRRGAFYKWHVGDGYHICHGNAEGAFRKLAKERDIFGLVQLLTVFIENSIISTTYNMGYSTITNDSVRISMPKRRRVKKDKAYLLNRKRYCEAKKLDEKDIKGEKGVLSMQLEAVSEKFPKMIEAILKSHRQEFLANLKKKDELKARLQKEFEQLEGHAKIRLFTMKEKNGKGYPESITIAASTQMKNKGYLITFDLIKGEVTVKEPPSMTKDKTGNPENQILDLNSDQWLALAKLLGRFGISDAFNLVSEFLGI